MTSTFKLFRGLCIFLAFYGTQSFTQPKLHFEKEKNRFNFAQMHLGYEYSQMNLKIPTITNPIEEQAEIHNIVFGGWHFWGMADFYLAFPVQTHEEKGRTFSPGVETAFRWYPTPISVDKLRPFLGIGFNFTKYQQDPNAPNKTNIGYPINAGLSLANRNFQLELGVRYQQDPSFNYFISTSQQRTFEAENTSFFVAIKRIVDTTVRAKRHGQINQKTGFYPFVGVGPSAAWITAGENSYFKQNTPWIDGDVAINIFPEISAGVHWKNSATLSHRTIFQVAWRQFNYTLKGYESHYNLGYNSFAFEIAQTLFDYHGFVPFVGLSYNNVKTSISGDISSKENLSLIGALFGWDILPIGTRSPWALRTNLRWYPKVELTLEDDQTVAFPNFEFNFIQWIYQF